MFLWLLLRLLTCCLFSYSTSNNLQTIYITRGLHKNTSEQHFFSTELTEGWTYNRMGERCLSNQVLAQVGLINYRRLKALWRQLVPLSCSFGDGIVTRVCQLIPGAPGKITVTTYGTTTIMKDSACQVKKMRGTTVVDEMLLLLWSCSCPQESGATYLTINVRKLMVLLSSYAAGRFLNAWDGSSYFPGGTVTQALRWLTGYQAGQYYFW